MKSFKVPFGGPVQCNTMSIYIMVLALGRNVLPLLESVYAADYSSNTGSKDSIDLVRWVGRAMTLLRSRGEQSIDQRRSSYPFHTMSDLVTSFRHSSYPPEPF